MTGSLRRVITGTDAHGKSVESMQNKQRGPERASQGVIVTTMPGDRPESRPAVAAQRPVRVPPGNIRHDRRRVEIAVPILNRL